MEDLVNLIKFVHWLMFTESVGYLQAEQEQCVYDQLTDLLKFTESEESSKQNDREVNRVNELIKVS